MILGAGFSRALYRPCPLTDELGEQVRSRLSRSDSEKLPPASFIDGRFEEWLSYLSEPQPHFTPEEVLDARALALRIIKAISEVLANVQVDALAINNPTPWLWRFLSVLHVLRAQVLTLNYDNFLESGLHSLGLKSQGWFGPTTVCEDDILAGLPPCADFPGPADQVGDEKGYDGSALNVEERRMNTFKLLKLHGSLSWYWLPDSGGNPTLRRWRLPGTFGELWDVDADRRLQELPAHEVFIVPPASLKGQRLMEPVMRQLWRRAADSVATADRIVLVGYSIPPADHSIIGLFSDGIQGRDVKIEIVNPAPSIVEQRLIRLGASPDEIECICGDHCIDDWTTREVDRLSRQTAVKLRNRTDLGGEILMFSSGPRVERFRSLEAPANPASPIIMHLGSPHLQLANPRMFAELRPLLQSCSSLVVEDEGQVLPVIDYWVREQQSGAMTTQLHLVAAGR